MWRCHSNAKYLLCASKQWRFLLRLIYILLVDVFSSSRLPLSPSNVCVCVCAKICRLICLIHHCAYRKCHRWFSVSHWRAHCSHLSFYITVFHPLLATPVIMQFFSPSTRHQSLAVHLFIIFCKNAHFFPPYVPWLSSTPSYVLFFLLLLSLFYFCFYTFEYTINAIRIENHVYFIIFHFSMNIWHLYLFALNAMMLSLSLFLWLSHRIQFWIVFVCLNVQH